MKMAGIEVVAYSEIDKKFCETHEKNFPESKLIGCGDIKKITNEQFEEYAGEVDMIFAGFPCQGFSQAGKKLPDDPRNTLFREFLRATKLIKPKYIIGENVKGLLKRKNKDGDLYINIIRKEFENLGYTIYTKVMKTCNYGIPQKRERLIIVGIKDEENSGFEFPQEREDTNNLQTIVNFSMEGALKITSNDFDISQIPDDCIIKNMDNDDTEKTEGKNKPHPNLVSLARVRNYKYQDKEYPIRLHFGKRIPVGGEVIDIRKSINTIICTYARQPRFFVPQQNKNGYYLRTLLPYELKQIQGFPADFEMCGNKSQQIVQIGNAVPPPLIYEIVMRLI